MTTPYQLGILISGRGSNMQAIAAACQSGQLHATIAIIIADNLDAKGLDFCKQTNISHAIIDRKSYPTKAAFESALTEKLKSAGVNFICLAGFMRLLSADFVNHWPGQIINIHPSLLPAFKGLDAQAQAIAAGAKTTGCTVHYVTAGMDEGPTICQRQIDVLPNDTAATLSARLLPLEHECYINALQLITKGLVRLENGVVKVTKE